MGVLIGKPINGISINGLEYVCDDNLYAIVFEDGTAARKYLAENGITEDDIEDMGIVFETVDDTEVSE